MSAAADAVRRRLFEEAGIDLDRLGDEPIRRCAGGITLAECAVARMETGSKDGECLNCGSLSPSEIQTDGGGDDRFDAEVFDLVSDIVDIARWERAGFKTDWTLYAFEYKQLFTVWKEAERAAAIYQRAKMSSELEYANKILKAAHQISDGGGGGGD